VLIATAGLPASGKSTLAGRLAKELNGVVLSKDEVRAALFPPPVLAYSREQDDLCMDAIFKAALCILRAMPHQTGIIDGRTFLRSYQIQDLLALAESLNQRPLLIECVCDEEVAKQRLEHDLAVSTHPAGNRTFELYLSLKAQAEPITVPHLVLDTGNLDLEECVRQAVMYVHGR